MRRLGVVMASALLALSLFAQGTVAQAGQWVDNEWCYDDPVVVVFGSQFKFAAAAHTPQASSITAYTYLLEVPSNAQGRTNVSWPHGRSGNTYVTVSYTGAEWSGSGSFTVNSSVTVSGPAGTDVLVNVSGPKVSTATYGGSTNAAVTFSTSVTPGASTQ